MTTEWTELNTLQDVAQAQKDGWEVEFRARTFWDKWDGELWIKHNDYRGRPKQPKTRTVKMLGWFDGEQDFTLAEGVEPKWPSKRVPSEDKVIEVEE